MIYFLSVPMADSGSKIWGETKPKMLQLSTQIMANSTEHVLKPNMPILSQKNGTERY